MTLEYHIQVHEDPLILFLVPRASHLLDSDNVACLPEAHLPYLAASATAHLPQILQVIDFCLVALAPNSQVACLLHDFLQLLVNLDTLHAPGYEQGGWEPQHVTGPGRGRGLLRGTLRRW